VDGVNKRPEEGGGLSRAFYGLENEILLKHIIVTTAATVAKKAIAWRYVLQCSNRVICSHLRTGATAILSLDPNIL